MTETMAFVRRFIDNVQIPGDSDLCESLVASDFVNHQRLPGRDAPVDRATFCASFRLMAEAFSDLNVEILRMTAAGDTVWTHKRITGRHTAPFRGVEPTGAVVDFEVMDILRIENGQIAEHWAIAESHRLLSQLGAG
ncbi:MAG: hypothetical protein ETSY1_41170 [Candidatus Entotheonella factor]|uniref:Ester cyclase n=1 Tax=Entotheonella factor TaxID=1429438 RepID=W4L4L3_ENTF1|nr:MAG: hypothetical protein ETSY1_41170 [Candidatus Entotheonella factor]